MKKVIVQFLSDNKDTRSVVCDSVDFNVISIPNGDQAISFTRLDNPSYTIDLNDDKLGNVEAKVDSLLIHSGSIIQASYVDIADAASGVN